MSKTCTVENISGHCKKENATKQLDYESVRYLIFTLFSADKSSNDVKEFLKTF